MTDYPLSVLNEVLRPVPLQPVRQVRPIEVPEGTVAEQVIERAAKRLRAQMLAGRARVEFDSKDPSDYMTACADTWLVMTDLEAVLSDEEAAVANAIFERAGWFNTDLKPTTRRAQVEMQVAVRNAARSARNFFAQQQALI